MATRDDKREKRERRRIFSSFIVFVEPGGIDVGLEVMDRVERFIV